METSASFEARSAPSPYPTEHRVADRRVVRLIQKWLRAGVLEEGKRTRSESGTVQGGSMTAPTQKITRAGIGRRSGNAVPDHDPIGADQDLPDEQAHGAPALLGRRTFGPLTQAGEKTLERLRELEITLP